jgi:hypothetical protein
MNRHTLTDREIRLLIAGVRELQCLFDDRPPDYQREIANEYEIGSVPDGAELDALAEKLNLGEEAPE